MTKEIAEKKAKKSVENNAEKSGVNNAEKSGVNNAEKSGVNNAEKSGVNNAEKSGVNNAEKSVENNAEKSIVNNAKKSVENNAEKSGVNNAEKSGVNNAKKSAENNAEKNSERKWTTAFGPFSPHRFSLRHFSLRRFSLRHFLCAMLVLTMLFLTGCGNAARQDITEENTKTAAIQTESETENGGFSTETPYGDNTAVSIEDIIADLQVDLSTVRLGGLKGPTSMGMVGILDLCGDFTLAGAADEVTLRLLKGELDIAAVPINLASVLYNKSEGRIHMIAINALGVQYIAENPVSADTATIGSMADMKGRTVYATGKGSIPEYILTYLLKENGLDISKDVDVQWKSEPAEVVALMASKPGSVAMLPQPYVTVAEGQVENLRVALNLTEEWDALDNGSRLITSALVVTTDFSDQHPDVVNDFLTAYAASVAYVNTNVTEAANLMEQHGIVKAAVAEKAIPRCNIVCITGADMMVDASGYLQILYGLDPDFLGGCLPSSDFYYGAF